MHYCKYFSKLTRGTLQLQELNKQLQVLAASYRALAADHAGLRHEAELEQQRRRPPPPAALTPAPGSGPLTPRAYVRCRVRSVSESRRQRSLRVSGLDA